MLFDILYFNHKEALHNLLESTCEQNKIDFFHGLPKFIEGRWNKGTKNIKQSKAIENVDVKDYEEIFIRVIESVKAMES